MVGRLHIRAILNSAILLIASTSLLAQTRVGFNPSGVWSPIYHEDELERTDPGSPVGDYLGMPINDDARLRADSWDADLISVPEHQCIPHSAIYAMRAPSNRKISTIEDPTTAQITAFIIDGTYDGPRTILDGRASASFAIRGAYTSDTFSFLFIRFKRFECAVELPHKVHHGHPKRFADIPEFQQVEPSCAQFVLRDSRLRAAKRPGYLDLPEALSLAGFAQQREEDLLPLSVRA